MGFILVLEVFEVGEWGFYRVEFMNVIVWNGLHLKKAYTKTLQASLLDSAYLITVAKWGILYMKKTSQGTTEIRWDGINSGMWRKNLHLTAYKNSTFDKCWVSVRNLSRPVERHCLSYISCTCRWNWPASNPSSCCFRLFDLPLWRGNYLALLFSSWHKAPVALLIMTFVFGHSQQIAEYAFSTTLFFFFPRLFADF